MSLLLSQSIFSLLHHHQVMATRERALKQEVADWDKAIQASTSTAAKKAKQQEDVIQEIKASLLDSVEMCKKAKARADEAEQGVRILQHSIELAKAILGNLSTKNDTLKAEVQILKDLCIKDQDEMAQRIEDAIETKTDKTLYRVWSTNHGVLNL